MLKMGCIASLMNWGVACYLASALLLSRDLCFSERSSRLGAGISSLSWIPKTKVRLLKHHSRTSRRSNRTDGSQRLLIWLVTLPKIADGRVESNLSRSTHRDKVVGRDGTPSLPPQVPQ